MNEPLKDLSHFILICLALVGPVAWMLRSYLSKRAGSRYDGEVPFSPGEVIDELRNEYPPLAKTVIQTHTEYLPLLLERIRETIDDGLDDPKAMALLERIDRHRAGEERRAHFTVNYQGKLSDLHLRWTRDGWDRIELHIQACPEIIRVMRRFKKEIPKALPG